MIFPSLTPLVHVSEMNYHQINGRPCRIMWPESNPSLCRSGVGNIIVKNLDSSINSDVLNKTLSAFGTILSCKVVANEERSSPNGYGYVHFEKEETADLVIQKLNRLEMNGKKMEISKFIPKIERYTNIYVKNFGHDYSTDQLRDTFEKFGKITSAKVMTDENGKCQGFGFVNFESHDAAANAVEAMNKSIINGHKICCGVAQKKEERQMELSHKNEVTQ